MEEKTCLRCLETHNEESDMCHNCTSLLEEAFELIENDPKVFNYYRYVEKQQTKVEIRLNKLKRLYDNGDTKLNSILKNTGKGIKKLYKLNALDAGVSAVNKIFNKDLSEDKPTDEELLLEEIVELENFVEMPPIEFVIYEYLIPEEQKNSIKEEDGKDKKAYVHKELFNYLIKDKFTKLDKGKQTKLTIGFVIVVSILLVFISFL